MDGASVLAKALKDQGIAYVFGETTVMYTREGGHTHPRRAATVGRARALMGAHARQRLLCAWHARPAGMRRL